MLDIRDHGGTFGGLSGSNIKSIQRGTTILPDGGSASSKSMSVALNNVDISKSFVIFNLYNGETGTYALDGRVLGAKCVSVTLDSENSLLIKRSYGYGPVTVDWWVVELKELKSKQSGSFGIATKTTTQTISSVDLAKSFLFYSYESSDIATTMNADNYSILLQLSSSSQLYFKQKDNVQKTVYWHLIELK
ncbi:hypothetical protein OKS35_06755 [Exiguobacterium sp. N5]|uniref:hypothetical protein n=1 Tax=Exiguobacterium sp. N5 TaxID=2990450 RepID=UPI0021F4ACDF|nr:hypothetical protein [Exiguobacterium sp. N5]MCV9899821.1 hypothetical protein [Exiguobacterium sp. N5]